MEAMPGSTGWLVPVFGFGLTSMSETKPMMAIMMMKQTANIARMMTEPFLNLDENRLEVISVDYPSAPREL